MCTFAYLDLVNYFCIPCINHCGFPNLIIFLDLMKQKLTESRSRELELELDLIVTKEELKKYTKKKKLNKNVKFVLNMLSHYKFRKHLINKANEYGCEVNVITEEDTSIT